MTTSRTPDVVSGLTTDWIPLTTPGPGPISECSTAIYLLPGAVSGFVAFDPYYGKWIDTAVKCLATEQSLWWDQHSDGGINDINLGPFACPSGYTTASVSTINAQTSFIGCCPSYVLTYCRAMTSLTIKAHTPSWEAFWVLLHLGNATLH